MLGRWRSRPLIFLVTLGVLLMLDVGRSVYARVGYQTPVQVWQPAPTQYADMTWPPGADLPASTPAGQRLYMQHCAVCHGPDGHGNGPAAPSLIPRPRDFTSGVFKYASTAAGDPPTDADLVQVVANGLQASAMPSFGDILSANEIQTVVGYVKSYSPVFSGASPTPIVVPPRPDADAASIARGHQLFTDQGCASCHGANGRARTTLPDARAYPTIARDLTAPWTFRGGSQPEAIWLRLTRGLAPSAMPSFADKTTPAERWDLTNYVVSLVRTPPWEPGGQLQGPGYATDPVKRGEYLAHAEMCGLCHTAINATGIYRADDHYLAGGMRVDAYPQGVFVSRNLTSDATTGIGSWSAETIAEAIRNGRAPDGVLNPYGMPWNLLHGLTVDDAQAIGSYLKSLPPVHNYVPQPLGFGVIETVVSKTSRGLPAAPTTSLSYADGDFADPRGATDRSAVQSILVDAQWVVLVVGAVLWIVVRPPARVRAWIGLIAAIVGVILVGLIGAAIYATPALGIIPPDIIASGATASLPPVNIAQLPSPEQVALAQRGRYLYAVASCALCHGNDGAGGGLKVSWVASGTLWVRNISSDVDTGIGGWSDAQIERAIRSGISRDGQQLHWQGMPWDHFSNWDEEDVRALVVYVQRLPPVSKQVPADRPPAADDCAVYTFWTSPSTENGCK
jgi:mono/diheme cytochrome c family protein